jgi:hypothetical protein
MNDHWAEQTAAAVFGVHLLVVALVGTILTLLLFRWRRSRIPRPQVLITRIALAGWLTYSSALPASSEGGPATTGAVTSPGPAPVVALHRLHFEMGGSGRHRMVA